MTDLEYQSGFGNEFESEALQGALPVAQFSPQQAPYGLYAEKFSNTAFTAPRESNRRTWFYRIRPSVVHGSYAAVDHNTWCTAPLAGPPVNPQAIRWDPLPDPASALDFVDSLTTIATNGDLVAQYGIGIHHFCADRAMTQRCLMNADGELLLVPFSGQLIVRTECGVLSLAAGEIAVIPRGMKFAVDPLDPSSPARGFVAENYGHALRLPERGLVGSDGFANTRDFLTPVADYIDQDEPHELLCRYQGNLYCAEIEHNPFDVVAWTGNAVPYKYDLRRFNVLGSVSFDHPDPSIYTVLSAPSDSPGIANLDLVVFPPRWLVAEHTFRPPWFHRNVMSEFMGLVYGAYDGKKTGFSPGGMSLHNALIPHGPDQAVFEAASVAELVPTKLEDSLAFMFESRYVLQPTAWAMATPARQADYRDCWQSIARRFNPPA